MNKNVKVAILIESLGGSARDIMKGIAGYSKLHGPWSFYLTPSDRPEELPKMVQWGGMGIIARIQTLKIANAVAATGLPVVAIELAPEHRSVGSHFSEIHPNPATMSQMAAEHLLARGFQRFAFCGLPRIWSKLREEAFVSYLKTAGFECNVYAFAKLKRDQQWSREQALLVDWLKSLPKPVGLMACSDIRARRVLWACQIAEVQVPDEIAVIGVDNEALFCSLSDPPLTSVDVNGQLVGFEAAKLLDKMMQRKVRKPRQIIIEPAHIAERQSTNIFIMEDREVAAALLFIRQNANLPLSVQDILRQVPLSRRALEMRFRKAVGRSLHEELQRVHIKRAKQLLLDTHLPLHRIAEMSGFTRPSNMAAIFRRETGLAPLKYRKQSRSK